MRHASFAETARTSFPICVLVPLIQKSEILKAYVDPFGLDPNEVMAIDLHQTEGKKKTPAGEMKEYITSELAPALTDIGAEYILCTDAEYFKVLTKSAKADANLGYVMDCAFGPWKVIYVPSHRAIFYDPDKVRAKIRQGIEALISHRAGSYTSPGASIIRAAHYPQTDEEIEDWLVQLLDMPELECDIEAFSLRHTKAGIGTITFAWSDSEGIAFPVDYVPHNPASPMAAEADGTYGYQKKNPYRRAMLKRFFELYQGKLRFHSIGYDVTVLIYQLFMDHILDTEGLLYGLEVMLGEDGKNWDCTKLITYLATNSCAGNKLSLKEQAQEFAGNYAVDEIEDIRKIPLPTLLQYNLVDGLSTKYVHRKHWDTLVRDNQLDVYENLFKPAMVDIIQMQLTGLPVNMPRVLEVKKILQGDERRALDVIEKSPIVQEFLYLLQEAHVAKRNAKLKKKQITLDDPEVAEVEFNPNSGPQLQRLLYEFLKLPVIAYTDSKQPATDGDTLKALKNHTQDLKIIAFLDAMLDYGAVNKILTAFIPALEGAERGPDGWHYLFGSFNLGGTLSGRLSSSKPNLQNLPATGSRYAKIIKSCFSAPPGWLFAGLDFNSLEDRISALTTKDPNKLKVYTDGYDGHCLRALAYFPDECPGIDPNSVESINSIAKLFPEPRQKSKVPTFALTYMGTKNTLMTGSGFSALVAQQIYDRYHELYKVSTAWVQAKLNQAAQDGYVTVAFGLRVRTPLLKQTIRGTRKTPYEAEAEGRSAGNALGQSWCLLNSRAGSEFMGKVRKSKFRLVIRPCAQIHDAQYYLIKDDISAVHYTNVHLVKAVEWQDHPDIAHDEVKLGGELSIFHPDWSKEITIPNHANEDQILDAIDAGLAKQAEAVLKKAA